MARTLRNGEDSSRPLCGIGRTPRNSGDSLKNSQFETADPFQLEWDGIGKKHLYFNQKIKISKTYKYNLKLKPYLKWTTFTNGLFLDTLIQFYNIKSTGSCAGRVQVFKTIEIMPLSSI